MLAANLGFISFWQDLACGHVLGGRNLTAFDYNNKPKGKIMGDRGNIVVRASQNNRDDVWFYGHWSGYRLEQTVQAALAKNWRWGDTSYLARIIFDEFTKDAHGEETGFGISTRLRDNEYPIVVVDDDKQRVFLIKDSALDGTRIPEGYEPTESWPYAEYIKRELVEAD